MASGVVVPRSISDLLVDTLLATEDRHFYEHDGALVFTLSRACGAGQPDGGTHGAEDPSTLTQRLVKNLFLSSERSLLA